MKGKLIVLEGIDGSGKTTQFHLLCERLAREGADFRAVEFPQYDSPSSAPVRMYLGGELGGGADGVNAYAASAFFAVDRYISYRRDEWGAFYDGGGLVLSARYATSNAIHQGAKAAPEELPRYLDWLYDFEFNRLGIPAPDLVIFLGVTAEEALARVRTRAGTDIHESDGDYLRRCAEAAVFAGNRLGWTAVSAHGDTGDVHEEIYRVVSEYL